VIVYACVVHDADKYERCAEPGLLRVTDSDPDAELLAQVSAGSIFHNYNLILDRVGGDDRLEALVIVHQDAEIVDPEFSRKVREQLADPEVAIVGCAGAVGVRSIAWWEGAVTWGSFTHRYEEMGGGEVPAVAWAANRSYARTGEVDSVDGFVLGLSPWAIRNLRFDESLGRQHGYDFDLCLQARSAGKKVVTADLRVIHHHSLTLLDDVDGWIDSHMRAADKWEGQLPGVESRNGDWKERARRAEAEAAAYRLQAGAAELKREAAQRQLHLTRLSTSWRLTAPLRALGGLFKRRG